MEKSEKNSHRLNGVILAIVVTVIMCLLVIGYNAIIIFIFDPPKSQYNGKHTTHGCNAFNTKNNCSIDCPVAFKSICIKDDHTGLAFCDCEEDISIQRVRDFDALRANVTASMEIIVDLTKQIKQSEDVKMKYDTLRSDFIVIIAAIREILDKNGTCIDLKLIVNALDSMTLDLSLKKEIDKLFK